MVAVVAALLCGAGVARANGGSHRGSGQFSDVKGLVTSISSTSMHVQTQSGAVTVGLGSSTSIMRIVVGSTADLARGEQIDGFLTSPGSGVLKFIHIERPPMHAVDAGGTQHAAHNRDRFAGERFAFQAKTVHSGSRVGGQIVSIGSNSITVRLVHGSTATYTLAGNVKVTKTLNGRLSDLAFGEMVFASVLRTSGIAATVTILSS
jgi:hypothetical protein